MDERHWVSKMGEGEDESGRRWSVSFVVTVRTMMADEDKRELWCVTVRTMMDDEDEREPQCDCDGENDCETAGGVKEPKKKNFCPKTLNGKL
nr:hypothetical protein CFP56_25279 [Quercus suber]